MLLAKKSEKGRTPSFAISCLTLLAVNVMTKMLPKIEKAMMPAMTRRAVSLPKALAKKTVAMSKSLAKTSALGTAQS